MSLEIDKNRRPISSRDTSWARSITNTLIKVKMTPNSISVWSIIFALFGAAYVMYYPQMWGFVVLALTIQLRLLCNLFDGMVAIELNQSNPLGKIYNEFPDRITDSIFLIVAGYVSGHTSLGMFAALVAAFTAYIRVFGGSVGLEQKFNGIMAKQHRMAVLSIALLIQQVEFFYNQTFYAILSALVIISVGSIITCITRTIAIGKNLENNNAK